VRLEPADLRLRLTEEAGRGYGRAGAEIDRFVIGITVGGVKPAYAATSTLEVAMLARTRVIRTTRRRVVEFLRRKTPREALAELPLRNPIETLDGARWQLPEPDAQPGRDRLGLAY